MANYPSQLLLCDAGLFQLHRSSAPGLLFLHSASGPQCLDETGIQPYWLPVTPSDVGEGYIQAERTGPTASSLLAGGKAVSIL